MAITLNPARQTALVAEVSFSWADLTANTGEAAINLPSGAVVTGGAFIVDTAVTGTGTNTVKVGDSTDDDRYKTGGSATAALSVTGFRYPNGGSVLITLNSGSTSITAGAGRLVVEYIVEGRSNEIQQ